MPPPGLEVEGIYRVSGRKAAVQLVRLSQHAPSGISVMRTPVICKLTAEKQMIQDIEKDEEKCEFGDREDVHSICNVLKQCRSLWT